MHPQKEFSWKFEDIRTVNPHGGSKCITIPSECLDLLGVKSGDRVVLLKNEEVPALLVLKAESAKLLVERLEKEPIPMAFSYSKELDELLKCSSESKKPPIND